MDSRGNWGNALVINNLYVEGGGDSKVLRSACRRGFREFIQKAGLVGRMPRIVACGGRRNAYESFVTASRRAGRPMLLVDSETLVDAPGDPWKHLRSRPDDGWVRPSGTSDNQCHLMVQVMESWFLADRQALKKFYGKNFNESALAPNPNVEEVSKSDVLTTLASASRGTQKGSYNKGSHSFEILRSLDPGRVEDATPYAKRFLDTLREESGERAPT